MSWGPCFLYYRCPACKKRFRYELDLIAAFGETFGTCPACGTAGIAEEAGAYGRNASDYEEVALE